MAIYITANTRLARILRQAYDKQQIARGLSVWTAPEILPLGAWLTSCWRSWIYTTTTANPVQLLSPSQERAIWEGIITRSDAGDALLQISPTADAAQNAWNLMHAWNVPFNARDWDDSKDTEAFHGWAEEFQRICEKRNWLSVALLPQFVAAKMASGEIPVPVQIHVAGFAEFTPAQESLFNVMRRRNAAIEDVRKSEIREHGSAIRVGFVDIREEIRSSARWARKLLESAAGSGHPEPSIGIVVPELSKYRGPMERVFAEELHPNGRRSPELDSRRAFNISLGPSLFEYPLIQAALLVLRIDPSDVVALKDVLGLLRCPFIANSHTEATAQAQLDVQLRRLREPELMLTEVAAGAPPGLKSALGQWQRVHAKIPSRQLPSDWASAFSNLLKAVGWPGVRPLDSAEYQTTAAWNEILSEFAGLDSVAGMQNRGAAISMLQRLASSRQFQPESETAPIQILGVFEASGLTFDHLWILGMHDGVWPGPVVANPFLPLRLQRASNLPQSSPQRELEFTRLLSEQLLSSSSDIVVSHPLTEGDASLRPSPMFSSLREVLREISIVEPALPGCPTHAELMFRSSEIEMLDDRNAPEWNGAKARGGTSIFAHQAACPFQAFAKVRLGAELLESAEPGLTAIDRGNLIHDVLHRIWSELGSHESLVDAKPPYLNAVIHDEVQTAITQMASKKRALQQPRFAAIEQARLERLASEWLELEKQRLPFIVLGQEERRQVNVGGIDLTIRADRIDRLDDGTHVVIDYKTSRHGPAEWEGTRPDEPQLPLYAITAGVPLGGVVFGVAKLGDLRFTGLSVADSIAPGVKAPSGEDALPNRIPVWRGVLEQLAADFRNGNAAIDPKQPHQSCPICGLQGLCRISESASTIESPDEKVSND